MTAADPHGAAALGFALAGIACLVLWPLFRSRGAMLLVQLFGISALAAHYALAGLETAAAANGLGALQIAASLLLGTRPDLRWIGYLLAAVVVCAGAATWQGLPSLLAAAGTIFITIGRVQSNPRAMRLLVLCGGPFWLAHDLLIASPVAVADALSLAVGVAAVLRDRPRRRSRPAPLRALPAAPATGQGRERLPGASAAS